MLTELARLVKKRPLFLGEQSMEEALGNPDEQDEDDEDEIMKNDPNEYEVNGEISISKTDTKKGLVFGWASVMERDGELVIDRDNDIIDDEWELEKSAYAFVASCRIGGDNHVRKGVSHLVESMVITKEKIEALGLPEDTQIGWWTGWQITDPDVMDDMASGKYTGFSVHGKGRRTPIEKGDETVKTPPAATVQFVSKGQEALAKFNARKGAK